MENYAGRRVVPPLVVFALIAASRHLGRWCINNSLQRGSPPAGALSSASPSCRPPLARSRRYADRDAHAFTYLLLSSPMLILSSFVSSTHVCALQVVSVGAIEEGLARSRAAPSTATRGRSTGATWRWSAQVQGVDVPGGRAAAGAPGPGRGHLLHRGAVPGTRRAGSPRATPTRPRLSCSPSASATSSGTSTTSTARPSSARRRLHRRRRPEVPVLEQVTRRRPRHRVMP
jgi:hypothetical protein